MRKQKGSLFQRMMAVVLSAVLVMGMVWDAVPMPVLAVEGSNSQESVSGNSSEMKEGENGGSENEGGEGESGGTENEGGEGGSGGTGNEGGEPGSVSGNNGEGQEPEGGGSGSVSGNDAENQEPEDGEQESVSGNDAESQEQESVSENDTILMALAVVEENVTAAAPGTITSDQTWDTQTLAAGTYTIPSGVTVTLNGILTVNGEVTIQGGGKLVRGVAEAYFTVTGSGHLTLQNIEADGASLSSANSLISVSSGGEVTLGDGCRIHHCIKSSKEGAALSLYSATAVFKNAVIENCQATSYGGAVYIAGGSRVTIQSGTYRNNSTTGSQYGGGCIYNSSSTLKIYGGSYIGNTSTGKAGCIYNTGKTGTETYLYGGYFQGNKSTYGEYTGSGAVLYSAYNPVETVLNLSGNLQFCGDGVSASGVDGVFLDLSSSILRKAQISSELKYSLPLYLKAEEGRVIAEGVGGYRLQKKDMKKISFFDSGSSGQVWYAKLDEANNQVILTATDPNYSLYVTYGANGGEGNVSDSGEYTSGDTVTVQPGDALHRDGYTFDGWNTKPDGAGTSYLAGSSFQITGDVTLYAQWKETSSSHVHDSITFTPWESTNSLPTAAGNYCLTKDVTMSGTWEAPAGTTGLCLNGYQVKYTGTEENKSFLQVNENATLNIYDCNDSAGTHTLTSPVTNGSVTIQGGLITGTGQKTAIVGSCICIKGTCNLYEGSIAGFSDTPGSGSSHGAVRVEGTFHMYGGAITHNRSGCGGGVNICGVNAHFYLHDGSISYNYADYDDGGGICINDTGSFEMTGGEIRGNKAASGAGGIHWYNDGNASYSVHLSDGVITENTTGGAAGGLKFDADPWQQFSVSGGIQIAGNQNKDGKESNLYLGRGSKITVGSDGFGSGAVIGVTTESVPTEQNAVAVTGHNKGDYSQYFQSDNPAYEIRNESDTVKLALPHQHTPVKKEKVLADCTHTGTGEYWQCEGTTGCGKMFSDQECTKEISEIPNLPAQGHSYGSTWEKDASGHWHECGRCGVIKDKTSHSLGNWQHNESGHWKVCMDCNYQTAAAAHTYDNDSDMNCNDCGRDRTGADKMPPTGSITIGGKSWDKLSESISFDLFFKEAQQALIQGQDTAGSVCSGVDRTYYYVSDTALTGTAVEVLGSTQWKEGTSVTLTPDRKCVVYAKITDKAGNAAYVSTGGLVFDATPPVITGVTDGAVYRSPRTLTVTDENLKTVTVNGEEVTLTNHSFTLEGISGVQTIVATDKAGNRSQVAVTVKTAAENVKDAEEVIKEALEEAYVSNNTTEKDIREAIEAALEKAGISEQDVQISIEDFEKTEATTGEAGSIGGTIVITSSQDDSVTDSVKLDKTIPKLPVLHTHTLIPVDAKDATCTEDGNKAYYVCSGNDGCGKWFSDAEGMQEITDKDSVVIPRTGHSYGTAWNYRTAEGHAHECSKCNGHDTVQAHTPGDAATETTPQTCTECGYIMTPALGHTCSPQLVEKIDPSCTTAGRQAYYHCEGCGKNYEDAEGTTLIADISAWGNIAALGHDWGEWKVTKKATATKPGEKERTCKRCDEKETETIPATGGGSGGGGGNQGGGSSGAGDNGGSGGSGGAGDDSGSGSSGGSNSGTGTTAGKPGKPGASGTGQPKVKQEKEGNIRKEVRVEGTETLDVTMETSLSELADIVLTETEKQQAAAGTDVKIVLDIKDAPAVISADDKTIVEAALGGSLAKGYTLGQYLDVNLYKLVWNSRSAITQTSRKITITIQVADSLKNTDQAKTRTFAVIRVHDGKAELLTDLDNEEDTITIETDRFSTYAIVYQDTAGKNGGIVRVSVQNGGNKSGGGMDDEPKTGDATPIELAATLSMIAGLTYLLLYFADRRHGMTEETKKEIVSSIIGWAKRGGRIRRYLALAAIFVLLVYYHSIGKKVETVQTEALHLLQSP